MQDRGGRNRAVCIDVVPKFGQVIFGQKKTGLVRHINLLVRIYKLNYRYQNNGRILQGGWKIMCGNISAPSSVLNKNSLHPKWDERCLHRIRGATQVRRKKIRPHSLQDNGCMARLQLFLFVALEFRFAAQRSIRRYHSVRLSPQWSQTTTGLLSVSLVNAYLSLSQLLILR